MTRNALLFWCLVGITGAIYGTMIFWSLPYISTQAAGLTPFDVRPFGYTFAQAQEFLNALTPAGAEFYRTTQGTLDMFFPGLFGLALSIGLWHLSPGWPPPLRHLAIALPLVSTIFDYAENFLVQRMLQGSASALTEQLVWQASAATVTKFTLIALAIALFLGLLIQSAVRRLRSGGKRP
jgi:hypothetical protein